MLEVRLVDRVGEVHRVVEHDHAVPHRELSEEDARGLRPRSIRLVLRRIISQHQHVERSRVDRLEPRLVALQLFEIPLKRLVFGVLRRPRGRPNGTVGRVHKIRHAQQPRLVP
jgi:hypothetical protein